MGTIGGQAGAVAAAVGSAGAGVYRWFADADRDRHNQQSGSDHDLDSANTVTVLMPCCARRGGVAAIAFALIWIPTTTTQILADRATQDQGVHWHPGIDLIEGTGQVHSTVGADDEIVEEGRSFPRFPGRRPDFSASAGRGGGRGRCCEQRRRGRAAGGSGAHRCRMFW